MWKNGADVPPDVRLLAPRIPLNRDELLLLALAAWVIAGAAWGRVRVAARGAVLVLLVSVGLLALRWNAERGARALARAGAQLRVSPHPSAPAIGDLAPWSVVAVERNAQGWVLVQSDGGRRGWVAEGSIARLGAVAR
jgi:hypothetical protein